MTQRAKAGAESGTLSAPPANRQDRKPSIKASPFRALLLPFLPTLLLAQLTLVPRIASHPVILKSTWAAVAGLLAWQVVLAVIWTRSSHERSFELVLRPQHYVQAAVQFSVYCFWGAYWPPVFDHAWLIFAQLVFAYAFDILLTWSRREVYVLGFGAFPIVFSTNLFLWFKDDWWYLQFLMIAVGFMGKEFVRWQREGRRVHIFNPSAFTLGLFSLVLIATGGSDLTWGQPIASTLTLAPHFYWYMFAVGLVVMYFFAITPVTWAAAATLFGLSALYSAVTGVPYFLDSEIPAAVFLGMHLLVTDPSTSPRTPLGKAIFGMLYGVGVFVLYWFLGFIGAPTFYDKLMCVPLLNLSVQAIDRWAVRIRELPLVARSNATWPRSNLVHMAGWIVFFVAMSVLGRVDGRHIGDRVPFWQQACAEGRAHACERLTSIEQTYCEDNSGWACNELGVQYREGGILKADDAQARNLFAKACELRFATACNNLLDASARARGEPRPLDLRLLLRERGPNLLEMSESELRGRACEHGWRFACGGNAP